MTAAAALSISASGQGQEQPVVDLSAGASQGCSTCCDVGLRTPNMYGDILGNRPLAVTTFTPGSSRQIFGFVNGLTTFQAPTTAIFAANLAPAPSSPVLNRVSPPPLTLSYLGQILTTVNTFTATAPITNGPLFPATVALSENATTTGDVQTLFATAGETAIFNPASLAVQVLRNQYNIFLVYDLVRPGSAITVAMANPVDGGLIGRTKISTGNNPLPRDRLIVDYDYINDAPLRADGQDVHRLSVGFEKTFLCGRASVELRAPFASTINTTSDDGVLSGDSTEFGNLHLTFKALLFSNEHAAASAGVGVSIPTADDTALRVAGQDVIRIENEAFLYTPFAALLLTPNDRLFAQAWFQYGYDGNSNPVLAGFGNLQQIGRLTDPELMQIDGQLGYWISRTSTECGGVRGFAPFVEIHYNKTTSGRDSVTAGALTVTDSLNHYNELNLSAGVVAQLGDHLQVTGGATVPLRDGNDRFGDYQLGVRVNWFFGGVNRAPGMAGY